MNFISTVLTSKDMIWCIFQLYIVHCWGVYWLLLHLAPRYRMHAVSLLPASVENENCLKRRLCCRRGVLRSVRRVHGRRLGAGGPGRRGGRTPRLRARARQPRGRTLILMVLLKIRPVPSFQVNGRHELFIGSSTPHGQNFDRTFHLFREGIWPLSPISLTKIKFMTIRHGDIIYNLGYSIQ